MMTVTDLAADPPTWEARRLEARLARRQARDVCAAARAARDRSAEARTRARALRQERRRALSARVGELTELADAGALSWPTFAAYLTGQAALVGRDPVIEEAKTLLAQRYGVSRGDAFAILRRASSHRNRKLHEIARRLVEAPLRNPAATPVESSAGPF
jgi:hypothetical protein